MERLVWNRLRVHKYFFGDENRDGGHQIDEENSLTGNGRRSEKNKTQNEVFVYFALIFSFVIFSFIKHLDESLPAPLKLAHLEQYPNNFNSERSQIFVKKLTDIGPRVVGSNENEHLAISLISNEINHIKNNSNSNSNSSQTIDIDYQTVSGSYYLVDFVNVYENVKNIVVRLRSGYNSSHSILVNCHFDSVPTSPGGSDNGINCAAMLEVLRVLSERSEPLKQNVIFLFNGAEESPLQASHGFIKHHVWAKDVRLFINLDAAGAAGKEMLFQAGPNTPWLLRQYSRAIVHPSAQSIGEEIFQSGLIPSDTDFRVFRDFGHIPGIDLAFYKNGYVYHTKYDGFKNIPLGSYQHIGDNLLSLVETIADAHLDLDSLNITAMTSKMIYFDVIGQFLIVYSDWFAVVINSFTIFLSLFISYKHHGHRGAKLGMHIVFVVLSWICALAVVLALTLILQYFKCYMSWFNHKWNLLGVYYLPTIATSIMSLNFVFEYCKIGQRKYSLDIHVQRSIHASRLLLTLALLVCTIFAIRSSYIFMVPVLMNVLLCHFVFKQKYICLKHVWPAVYFFGQLLISTFSMYLALIFTNLIIPVTGRMGASINTELLIAVVSFLLCILVYGLIIPIFLLIKNTNKSCVMLLAVSFLNVLLIILTPIGFPYRVDTKDPVPQRYYIHHMERVFYDLNRTVISKDNGYYMLDMDANSPSILQHLVSELNNVNYDDAYHCENFIFCGLPVYSKRFISKKTTWVPTTSPVIPKPTALNLTKREQMSEDIERFFFMITGPSKIHMIISPMEDAEIANWSLMEYAKGTETIFDGKTYYFILYNSGDPSNGSDFWIDVKTNLTSSDPMLNIVYYGRFAYHDDYFTKEFKSFLKSFPDWAHISPEISSYQSYLF